MTRKKRKIDLKKVKTILPYVVVGVIVLAIAIVGSIDKNSKDNTLSLNSFASEGYKVSVDQISELYIVADISDALNLASASDVASNYVITSVMYGTGQTSGNKLEKPNITDITTSRGVIQHVVQDGENMDIIAAKYHLTTDQIRWSNGLKTTGLDVGNVLYLPSVPGIVYVVKAGETAEGIAEKYGSSAKEIIALNDLEVSGVKEGTRIVIKDGVLPETERPEYVAPVRYSTYSYLGNTSERENIEVLGYYYSLGGPYVSGQCTQWAWYNRQDLPGNLGNARDWARNAENYGYYVDQTPSAGAIFQTSAGWYGHVGYVEGVNGDGSIVVTEMNYGYTPYRVVRSTIPASKVGNFYYIH